MEKSNGRLKVDIYPSGVLGSDEDLIEQALQGVNVVVLTDASRMSNYVPDMPCMRNMGCMISWRRAC
ncbi:hypothetical protein SDC9_174718 [bioreactor metagenome]|uniref:Uncharacterized protein n=1 Tax=bioreactor metagenome TaxID=1076179 RepID=A0A645GK62_9ZZZZ